MNVPVQTTACSCCGEERARSEMGALACHPDTVVCRGCVQWLANAAGIVSATPIFATSDMIASTRFYEAAGFQVDAYDDGYAFVLRGGAEVLHLAGSDTVDPAHNAAALYINTPQQEQWHAAWQAAGLPVSEIADQEHGMREFHVADPSGNLLRVGTNIPG